MGQTYSVYLKVRFNDEQGAVKALRGRLQESNDLARLASENGLDYGTIDGLLRHFFADWERGHKWTPTTDPDVLCGNFDASYSWESVMIEAFQILAPYLEDGSSIKIYPDSDYDHLVVKGGEAQWIH